MIAKGKSISHGAAMMEYAAGREKAEFLCSNHLDLDFEDTFGIMPDSVWSSFKLHAMRHSPIENSVIRFELSPTREQSKDFTDDDWKTLVCDFMEVMDSIKMVRLKDKKGEWREVPVKPTNLKGSQSIAFKHLNTDDPHLHFLVNRIDENGNINDDAFLLNRAFMAAQIINKRRGWQDTLERSEEIKDSIKNTMYDVLRSLEEFTWDKFKEAMEAEGLIIKEKRDSESKVVSYRVHYVGQKNEYKASDIDRKLTAAHIKATWEEIHDEYEKEDGFKDPLELIINKLDPFFDDTGRHEQNNSPFMFEPAEVVEMIPPQTLNDIDEKNHHHIQFRFYECDFDVKRSIESIIQGELKTFVSEEKESATDEYQSFLNNKFDNDNAFKIALLLFANYVDAATSMSDSIGGGGSTTTGGWGKKDDEDEEWARRCARQAVKMCKPWYLNKKKGLGI